MANPMSVQSLDIKNDFEFSSELVKLLRRPLLYPTELPDQVSNSPSEYRNIHLESNAKLLSAPKTLFTLIYTDLNRKFGGKLGEADSFGSFLSVSTESLNSKAPTAIRQQLPVSSSCTKYLKQSYKGDFNAKRDLPSFSDSHRDSQNRGLEARQSSSLTSDSEARRCLGRDFSIPGRQHKPGSRKLRSGRCHEPITYSLSWVLSRFRHLWEQRNSAAHDKFLESRGHSFDLGHEAANQNAVRILNQSPDGIKFSQIYSNLVKSKIKTGVGKVLDLLNITILNYEKFNPRNDRTNHVWFRFENKFFEDQVIFSLATEQQRLFIFLCCQASKKNAPGFEISLKYSSAILRRKTKEIVKDLEALIVANLVSCDNLTASVRQEAVNAPSKSLATIQDSTNKQTNSTKQTVVLSVEDFERVWECYPRKVEKTEARDRFFRLITDPRDLEDLAIAVHNYASECHRLKTQDKYIKHFSAFLGTESKQKWRDWVEYEAPLSVEDQIEAEFLSRHRDVSQ